MKVYVLIECPVIEVLGDSCCECCGPESFEYNGNPKIIAVYKTLKKLISYLKKMIFTKKILNI